MPATHDVRRRRLHDAARATGAEAALVTRLVNVRYLTGFTGSNAALLVTGEGALLDYQHFTVQMHPTRRLAWWVAWNIDGLRLFPSDSISRSSESR